MNGLMDSAGVQTPLLRQTIQKVEASVPKQYLRGYHAIMAAGLKTMFDNGTFHYTEDYLRSIKSPQDVPKMAAHGIVKLISIIFNQTKGRMPLEPSISAAVALLCHALDYVDREMKLPVTPEILSQSTHLVSQGMALFLKQATKMSDEDFQRVLNPKAGAQQTQATPGPSPAQGAEHDE